MCRHIYHLFISLCVGVAREVLLAILIRSIWTFNIALWYHIFLKLMCLVYYVFQSVDCITYQFYCARYWFWVLPLWNLGRTIRALCEQVLAWMSNSRPWTLVEFWMYCTSPSWADLCMAGKLQTTVNGERCPILWPCWRVVMPCCHFCNVWCIHLC